MWQKMLSQRYLKRFLETLDSVSSYLFVVWNYVYNFWISHTFLIFILDLMVQIMAISGGGCVSCVVGFFGGVELVECLAWSVVQFVGDSIEVGL